MDRNEIHQILSKENITLSLMGLPGCGKKTLGQMLQREFSLMPSPRPVIISETGELFRNAPMTKPKWYGELANQILATGNLLPPVLAINLWTEHILTHVKTNEEHIIFDGSPRLAQEFPPFMDFMSFMGRKIVFVYIAVKEDTALNRMKGRGVRIDTATDEARRKKIQQYREHTEPVLLSLVDHGMRIDVNGEGNEEAMLEECLVSLAGHYHKLAHYASM